MLGGGSASRGVPARRVQQHATAAAAAHVPSTCRVSLPSSLCAPLAFQAGRLAGRCPAGRYLRPEGGQQGVQPRDLAVPLHAVHTLLKCKRGTARPCGSTPCCLPSAWRWRCCSLARARSWQPPPWTAPAACGPPSHTQVCLRCSIIVCSAVHASSDLAHHAFTAAALALSFQRVPCASIPDELQ